MKKILITSALLFAASAAFAAAPIQATGKVVSVNPTEHTVKLIHDPIPALHWPAMMMVFTVQKGVALDHTAVGDAVTFTLTPRGKDDYVISGMKKK
jgi:Cu/Ag efflux protein CusF